MYALRCTVHNYTIVIGIIKKGRIYKAWYDSYL